MPRRGNWPPNSFGEWVVGQNFRGRLRAPNEGSNAVLRIELSEDEVSGDDTISITYPGRRRRDGAAEKAGSSSRKVRFDGNRKPLKSALKKTANPNANDSSDTLIDTSDGEDAAVVASEESSDLDDTDTSDDDGPPRRRDSKLKKRRAFSCKKDTDSDSSAAKDALPHPKCHCDGCVKGRKILKAIIKFQAKQNAESKQPDTVKKSKNKSKQNEASSQESSTDDAEAATTEVDASQAETSEPEATEADTTEDDMPPSKGKKHKQKQKQKQKNKQDQSQPTVEEERNVDQDRGSRKTVTKGSWKMPTYPQEMQPNWIMPPRTKVMRVEHAIEKENDPRPNAFFDSAKGITRVYHGPMYGNHMGELYGNRIADHMQPYGAGWPPNWHQNPQGGSWYMPGPPPGLPIGPNMPAINTQRPLDETGMREAASKGMGLSGMPGAPPSPTFGQEATKAESKKAGSDKASKKDSFGWDGAVNTSNGADMGWGGADNNNSNGWGTFEKQDGVASPANFDGFGSTKEEKFERRSNKSGSQKDGSQKNGNGWTTAEGTSWPQANNDGASQGNFWGQNNSSGENNAGGGTGNSTWDSAGAGGEPKQSPKTSQAHPNSKSPAAANSSPAKGAANETWNNNNNNNNQPSTWDNQNGGWPEAGGSASKKNTPRQNPSLQTGCTATWGGPPSTNPAPNNWNDGSSRRNSPHWKGAFPWPAGGAPPSEVNKSSDNNTACWQGGYPSYWQSSSGQATGLTQSGSWMNPNLAQDTGGKAAQW